MRFYAIGPHDARGAASTVGNSAGRSYNGLAGAACTTDVANPPCTSCIGPHALQFSTIADDRACTLPRTNIYAGPRARAGFTTYTAADVSPFTDGAVQSYMSSLLKI
jgi:hypothetical protein